jgi:hypothetical protein
MATNFLTGNLFTLENQEFIILISKKLYIEGETKKDFLFSVRRLLFLENDFMMHVYSFL